MKLVIEDNAVYEYDEQCLKIKGISIPADIKSSDQKLQAPADSKKYPSADQRPPAE